MSQGKLDLREAQDGIALTHFNILDHGYVEFIECWGSDERIIEAARMSTGKGFQGWDTDKKLLAYLYNHKHMTPFEMAGMVIEVKAPIFVFREWHRHRTQSYNEMSARYIPLPDENYVPKVERLMFQGGTNKQAQAIIPLTVERAENFQANLIELYEAAQYAYTFALDRGVPKELARLCLPVGRYSKMRASANLRNWLAFLTLRMDENAQWEIRQYAMAIGELVKQAYPRTWELFINDFTNQRQAV
jgi:thymidylate synthase (FAD)